MRITVNGHEMQTGAATLAAVLAELEMEGATVATALNGTFVPARRRSEQPVEAGDAIEIVAPRQGG
jgi:sulfur carrier protein